MPPVAPKADAAVPMAANPLTWVLIQTAPRVEVLAVSESRDRLWSEFLELIDAEFDRGGISVADIEIRPANILF